MKLTPVEMDKIHKNFSQNKTVLQKGSCTFHHSTEVFTELGMVVVGDDDILTTDIKHMDT